MNLESVIASGNLEKPPAVDSIVKCKVGPSLTPLFGIDGPTERLQVFFGDGVIASIGAEDPRTKRREVTAIVQLVKPVPISQSWILYEVC